MACSRLDFDLAHVNFVGSVLFFDDFWVDTKLIPRAKDCNFNMFVRSFF